MKTTSKKFPITTLHKVKDSIDTNPDYQRPPVWKTAQKELLIDTILRGYDIPKIYMERVNPGEDKFEVVDGQQRLRAIWEFCEGKFSLSKNPETKDIDGVDCKGKKYNELSVDLVTRFGTYEIDAVIVEDAEKTPEFDEIRDMFLRLQGGTSLNEPEKRNAMTGNMRDFVKEMGEHPFFKNTKISGTRYASHAAAAQIICLELAQEPTNVTNTDLAKMYREKIDFDIAGDEAKRVKKTLDYLLRAFPEYTPELAQHSVITLYLLASRLLESYVHEGTEKMLHDWFIKFEQERKKNEELDDEDINKDITLMEYKTHTSNASDKKDAIRSRIELVKTRFFLAYPEIELKDDNRLFSNEQKLAIFRRDERKCQLQLKCDGKRTLSWDNCHADHKTPHSKGGKTVVSNGQLACPACNYAKGNKML